MKFRALFAMLFGARAKKTTHNENLRAGEYFTPVFSPWKGIHF